MATKVYSRFFCDLSDLTADNIALKIMTLSSVTDHDGENFDLYIDIVYDMKEEIRRFLRIGTYLSNLAVNMVRWLQFTKDVAKTLNCQDYNVMVYEAVSYTTENYAVDHMPMVFWSFALCSHTCCHRKQQNQITLDNWRTAVPALFENLPISVELMKYEIGKFVLDASLMIDAVDSHQMLEYQEYKEIDSEITDLYHNLESNHNISELQTSFHHCTTYRPV